jgi:2'-5' RNA ligase
MRTFIALPLPNPIIHQLSRVIAPYQGQLKKGLRWVSPDTMHLTLRFLGESTFQQVIDLRNALQSVSNHGAIHLQFSQFGVFPNWKQPTTLWVGFEPNAQLVALQQMIEQIVRECGYLPEKKPFHPHLTVARVQRPPTETTIQQIQQAFSSTPTPPIGRFEAGHVVLFESILSREGAKHQVLQSIALQ